MSFKIEAAMDSFLDGMDKQSEDGLLSYTGAVELDGAVVGVSMLFFGGGLCRAMVQLTEVPEAFTTRALRLCERINRGAIYSATLDEGVFLLMLDMQIADDFDAELVAQGMYALIEGARLYHLEELRGIMGRLGNELPQDGGSGFVS